MTKRLMPIIELSTYIAAPIRIGHPIWMQDEDGMWMHGSVIGTFLNEITEDTWYNVESIYPGEVPAGKKGYRTWDCHRARLVADPEDLNALFHYFAAGSWDWDLFPGWKEEQKDMIQEQRWKDSDPTYVPEDPLQRYILSCRKSMAARKERYLQQFGIDLDSY